MIQVSLKKIMVPTDFLASSRRAVDYAIDLSKKYDSELIILTIVDDRVFQDGFLDAYIEQEVLKNRNRIFEEKLDSLREEVVGIEPDLSVKSKISYGVVFAEIINCAKEENIDLIVMGTHGTTTGIAHALIGSTAEKVVRKAPCSVMVIR